MSTLLVMVALSQFPGLPGFQPDPSERYNELRLSEAYQRRIDRQARLRSRPRRLWPNNETLWSAIPYYSVYQTPYVYPYWQPQQYGWQPASGYEYGTYSPPRYGDRR